MRSSLFCRFLLFSEKSLHLPLFFCIKVCYNSRYCMEKTQLERYNAILDPKKKADHAFFLSLLNAEEQKEYEDEHMSALLWRLKTRYVGAWQKKVKKAREEIAAIQQEGDYSAENIRKMALLNEEIRAARREMDAYKCFFDEPYFARMDLTDDIEGYNSYYIGKKGDVNLEIVDWRAPVAKKYYQKSQLNFRINEYHYKTILRRALRTQSGRVLEFKNEYLSVRDYLSREEIAGRDEEIIFDPYLKQIIRERKEESGIRDIIETIQERQYDIITRPETEDFVVQGCAGSGKTMILLHRLSYLMYNNERIHPHDVLVITPSNSFNTFINELAQVLELETVKTSTIEDYFLLLLRNVGIELSDKIRTDGTEPEEYLKYVYSDAFSQDLELKLKKIFDGVYGLFASEECRETLSDIRTHAARQKSEYEWLKNASLRVRRAVLGEIKERKEGGFYYTKPFRDLMNAVLEVEEFLSLDPVRLQNQDYFYRQLTVFYKSIALIARNYERVCAMALQDLAALRDTVEREIRDLKRYKLHKGEEQTFTYADRIERREALLAETARAEERVERIRENGDLFGDFYEVLRGEKMLVKLASCETTLDRMRYFYREVLKKLKRKYGVESLCRSDAYVFCHLLTSLGVTLTPKHAFVFVDEGQDVSAGEYHLLRINNPTAHFNVFGDLQQNITPYRGLAEWNVLPGAPVYELNQNYRNTNQIVDYVSDRLHIPMQPIGFDGDDVQILPLRGLKGFFAEKKGLKAVIVSASCREKYAKKSYHDLGQTGTVSKRKINYMTVYESKGLEFTAVAVIDEGMTEHEKYIAYTRALKDLAIVHG